MKRNKKTPFTTDHLAELPRPEGWDVSVGDGWIDDGETVCQPGKYGVPDDARYVKFERRVDDLHVTIAFTATPATGSFNRDYAFRGAVVEGNVTYNGRCFTRRGIDTSSCQLRDTPESSHEYSDLTALLNGEWQRCVDAHTRSKTMEAVPGLPGGWRVTPDRKAKITSDLRAGRAVSFTPHGMGIGYEVRTDRRVSWSKPLPKETSKFFGVTGTLYYTTMDCD